MQTLLIAPEMVDGMLRDILPFLTEAASASKGRYTEAHILEFVEQGAWQLWAIRDPRGHIGFVAATEAVQYPTGLKSLAWRFGIGEGYLKHTPQFIEDIKWQARQNGCTRSEGCFRKGWKKQHPFNEWSHSHEFLEAEL